MALAYPRVSTKHPGHRGVFDSWVIRPVLKRSDNSTIMHTLGVYLSLPGDLSQTMQPPQQIDPSLASQQSQGFYPYLPPGSPFIQGLSSLSSSESVCTPSDTSLNLKRSSSVIGHNDSSSTNKRPRDDGRDQATEKEPKVKLLGLSRCVSRVCRPPL